MSGDITEVFRRLFDHRPFLSGEINNFKHEFEDKRGDREVESLFKALEHTTEIKQVRFEKVVEASDANLPRTIADIQVALHMCEETLKVEDKFKSLTEESFRKKNLERQNRLKIFREENDKKLQKIQETYEQRAIGLRKTYQ